MAFTEFCCRSGGSNLNAGTRTGSSTEPSTSADLTYASGSWVAGTGVFTVASGDPVADGVAVGDFASVYADGSTTTGFVGRVTARTTTTITVSLTVKAGTAPVDGTSTRTVKIGGAWRGPNAADRWPFTSIDLSALTESTGLPPRINLKTDQTYSTTIALNVLGSSRVVTIEGYTTSYGDNGRANIDGGTSGAAYVLLTCSSYIALQNIELSNNGATGEAALLSACYRASRVVCRNSRGSGFLNSILAIECEAYLCNASNTNRRAGFYNSSTSGFFLRCISHDNAGSNSNGFLQWVGCSYLHCIADTNGGRGFHLDNTVGMCVGCDAYNNGSHGFHDDQGAYISIYDSCNAVKNGGWGINIGTTNVGTPLILNCGFGTGTQVNTSGAIGSSTGAVIVSQVNYANDVTPWTDPANGDFGINLAASRGTGRGSFFQTQSGYSGTVGYPDIGAAQSQASGSGGIPIARGMHGGMR